MSRDPLDRAMAEIFFSDRPRLIIDNIKPVEDEYFDKPKEKNVIKVLVKNQHTNVEFVADVPVNWEGVTEAKCDLSIHPSKREPNRVYWKASLQIDGREKPIDKFGKVFDTAEQALDDFYADDHVALANMMFKAFNNPEATR